MSGLMQEIGREIFRRHCEQLAKESEQLRDVAIEFFYTGRAKQVAKENAFVAKLQRWLNKCRASHQIWHFRTHQAGRTKSGIPDIFIVFYGLAVFVEAKAPGGKATKIQLRRIDELRVAGATAIVATTVEEVRDALVQAYQEKFFAAFTMELPKC